jgi:phytoene dehydrogenase-like protein
MITNPCRPGPWTLARSTRQALRHRRHGREMLGMVAASAAQVICERFEHEMVRGLLGQLTCAAVGPLTGDGSGLAMITTGFLHRWGALRPVGGTGALITALTARLTVKGGTVRCAAPVRELVLSQDRVTGVRLDSGQEIGARRGVIATCDPRTALAGLLPAGTLDHATRTKVEHIPGCSAGVVPFKVDVAVGRHVTFPHHPRPDGLDLRHPSLLAGGFEQLMRACRQSAAGHLPDDINLWISTPTAADPGQAPDGHDVLYLYVPVMPADPSTPWSGLREDIGKRIVGRAGEFLDGLDAEIGRYVEDPETMSARVHTTAGAQVFHVDFGLLRSGPLRPAFGLAGSRTPVPGLFLGGGGSHPGPGITGVPGRIAAREILRDRRRSR